MRAAVLDAPESIAVRERPRSDPGAGEVLVRVEACGVCTTDAHLYAGGLDVPLPLVPGHESAGEIVACGDGVDRYTVGDRVAINPSVPCHACRECAAGRENRCPDLTSLGGAADTVRDGSFAEFVAVPVGNVAPIGDLDAAQAAFAEPLGCVVHAVDRLDPDLGDSGAVVGAGPIGLLLVQVLRLRGASPIAVSEPDDDRRALARDLGADVAVDPTDGDPVAAIHDTVGPVDAAIEAVGATATLEQAWNLCGDGGTTMVFGVPPADASFAVSPFEVFYHERDLLGTYSLTPADFSRAVRLLRDDRIDGRSLVTHDLGLEDLPAAFDRMDRNVGLKQLVRP